ncbi:MAG: HEPN domain-containing protein [Cyanobacteria bacterium]|nr:HEPN domain-containing protein [Cyanobacteriota bacterium]MDA0867230.1 HEPN domain-containing protein [Cyanobacteriota bacterium]
MSKDKVFAETRRWLDYAEADLKAANALIKQQQSFAQQICFLSQQAAEKGLKAALIFMQIEFPFRHDLDLLRNLLPEDWPIHKAQPDLTDLTEWAVEARYPSHNEEATTEDARTALAQAQAIWDLITSELKRRGLG